MIKNSIFFILMIFLIGCYKNRVEVENSLPSISLPTIKKEEHKNQITLNGMQGPYPETIKDKKLGEGLLNNEYSHIISIILNNLKENNDKLKVAFYSDSNDADIQKIIKEMKIYFNKNPHFLVLFDKSAYPDVTIKIKKDEESDIIAFEIYFENKKIFIQKAPKYWNLKTSLKELEKEALSDWSKIKIKTNDGGEAIYYIMKRPVLVSEFYNKYTKAPTAVTSVSFDEADDYCYKKGGSISTLYVFEYALREGLILPATKYGASEEFVAPFDPANEEDMRLKKPGDIVFLKNNECEKFLNKEKRDKCYAENMDYSMVYVFDFRDYTYKIASREGNMNTTFRCIKKGD